MLGELGKAMIEPVTDLISEFITDKDKAAQLAHDIAQKAEDNATALAKGQMAVNQTEAQHRTVWVAGWRPFIGWVCGLAMLNNYIVVPYVSAFSGATVPQIMFAELLPILLGMLGLGAYRTHEKSKGLAK